MTREALSIYTTQDQSFHHPLNPFDDHRIDAECPIEDYQSTPTISFTSDWTIESSLDESYANFFPGTPTASSSWDEDLDSQTWSVQDGFPTESAFQELSSAQYRREKSVDRSAASEFRCSLCDLSFRNRVQLEQHAKQLKHRCFRCPHPRCTSSYYRRDLFTRHKKVHQNAVHPCVICRRDNHSMVFRRKDHLSQHIRNRHPAFDLEQDPENVLQRTDSCSTLSSLDVDMSGESGLCDPRLITSSCSGSEQLGKPTSNPEIRQSKGPGVQEIVRAIRQSYSGSGHDQVLHTFVERLDLERGSKTLQVAEKLIMLALQSPEVLGQCIQSN